MQIAQDERLRSIAFPAISTGIYGYPIAQAAAVAVATVKAELAKSHSPLDVTFACFGQDTFDAYLAEGITRGDTR